MGVICLGTSPPLLGPKGSVQEELGTWGERIDACGIESQCVNLRTHKNLLELVQWKVSSTLSVSDTTCLCNSQSANLCVFGSLYTVHKTHTENS